MFQGEHCETTATGTLLVRRGIKLSEPMMFGLGEGLGFVFLNLKSLNLPFIGGRSRPFELTRALCRNLEVELIVRETASRAKAFENISGPLDEGHPVGLQLDSYHLPYFSSKIHFAGHAVACLAIEGAAAALVDTRQQGGVHHVPLWALEKARFERGPMAAKARSWSLGKIPKDIRLKVAVKAAIRRNAKSYLRPAFKGMSHLGIEKMARSVPRWLEIAKSPEDLILAALLMERAGTGGAIFRRFYRDFLGECADLPGMKRLEPSHREFQGLARDWSEVASLIEQAGRSGAQISLEQAGRLCAGLAKREKEAMERLVL